MRHSPGNRRFRTHRRAAHRKSRTQEIRGNGSGYPEGLWGWPSWDDIKSAASSVIDTIPVVGAVKAGIEACTGVDLITGAKVDRVERALSAAAGLVPGGAALKKAVTVASKAYSAYQTGIDVIETGERLVEAAQSGGLQGLAAAVGTEAQSRVEAKVVGAITGGVARGVAAVGKSANARVSAASSESPDGASAAATCGNPTSCFTAGTPVAVAEGTEPIEEITVGERVLTPDCDDEQGSTAVDPSQWRKVTLTLRDPAHPDDLYDVVLLRPVAELGPQGLLPGARLWLDIEELGTRGWGEVVDVAPCPPLESGPGRIVLMTVTHENCYLHRLWLDGAATPLEVTGYHKLWSATRQTWTSAADLEGGEHLRTLDGDCTVARLERVPGIHRVYNFEVETEHCYFAGTERVLGHNAEDCRGMAPGSQGVRDSDLSGGPHAPDRELNQMMSRAAATGSPQGQWASNADAHRAASQYRVDGPIVQTVPIAPGDGIVVHHPVYSYPARSSERKAMHDGVEISQGGPMIRPAMKAIVIPKDDGMHTFPIDETHSQYQE